MKKKGLILLVIIIGLLVGCSGGKDTTKETFNIEVKDNVKSVNDEIFISTGDHNEINMTLVTSNNKAILIDTGFKEKEALKIKNIIKEKNLKLDKIIISHFDDEQLNNLGMFKQENTDILMPQNIKNEQIVELGDKKLKLLLTNGHNSNGHISVDINNNILVAGDILTNNKKSYTAVTYNEYGFLLESLKYLQKTNYELIIPSHGDIIKDKEFISKKITEIENRLSKYDIKADKFWSEIDDDIIVSSGNEYTVKKATMVLAISGKEVTMIDTGITENMGKEMKKFIEENGLKLKNLIITHDHYDHTNNLDMFNKEGVNLYTYDNSNDGDVIKCKDKEFKIIFTPGHAKNRHLSVLIDEKIFVAGDILASNIDPVRLVDTDEAGKTVINTLEKLNEKQYDIVIPGHGDVCLGNSVFNKNIEILKREFK
ncbi:MAG: MBL fold metallo-hydrolase [Firmicutes bacterium]|nr:MBL fold metallo-hydrolase [Bacillota bacterium]